MSALFVAQLLTHLWRMRNRGRSEHTNEEAREDVASAPLRMVGLNIW